VADPDEKHPHFTTQTVLEACLMAWITPAYEDLRLGFEINLYVNNR